MIKAVLFDLDGTLIDSTDAIVASMWHLFDTIGEARPTREEVIAYIGLPLEAGLATMTTHDVDDCVRIYRAQYFAIANDSTVLLPHALEMLRAFRAAGLRIGFVTSKKKAAAELVLEHLGVLDFFECRIGPDEAPRHKPDPAPIFVALEQLGLTPEEVVFVGDMHFDAGAAQAAGTPCLLVATGYQSRAELEQLPALAVYDGLDEVCRHVLSLATEPVPAPSGR